jgi:uncharacterized protein YjiS (DUF1127 family)
MSRSIAPQAPALTRPASGLRPFARVNAALAIWRQRRALVEMPEHLRRDVGLSEAQIQRELRRPVWDVPQFWRL